MSARSVVVNAQRRFQSRRRRLPAPLLIVAAAVVALVVGGWLVANSSLVDVREVTVEGTSRLTTEQVLDAARVTGGGSLVLLDSAAIERRVARLRPVAAVTVTRHWPHDVVIRVVERRPVAVVNSPGQPMLLDATGVAFAPAGAGHDAGQALVEVQVDEPVPGAGETDARAAMQVLATLPPTLRSRVTEMRAPTPSQVRLQLRDGRTVVWGSPTDNATKVAVLRSLLRRDARFYDVSTPDVVVTR
jgi:cell division protein FtsQ